MLGCGAMKTLRSACVLGLFLFAGCPQPAKNPAPEAAPKKTATADTPSAPKNATATATDAETPCTLDTQLVPGIPGSPGHPIPSTINPNGNSELAQLMRTMQGDLKEGRTAIGKGEHVAPLFPRFRKIRCAWPTNAGDRNAAFDSAAQNYLAAVKALDAAKKEEAAAAYEHVLDGCRACHEQSCGGAIPAIEALRMAKADK